MIKMKTRWMEYLAAALERGQARQRRSWQRTRRLGRRHYILQVVLYFWLMMVAFNFFASWIIAAYFHKPLVLLSPHRTWGEILVTMIFGTTGIYFVGARSWRLNERRYGEAPPCESVCKRQWEVEKHSRLFNSLACRISSPNRSVRKSCP